MMIIMYFTLPSLRVTAVYGGKGKVKVKKRLWGGGDEGDKKKYSFKYLGPEKAACLLEKALLSVKVGPGGRRWGKLNSYNDQPLMNSH